MNELKTMNAEELAAQPFLPPAFIVDNLLPMGLSVLGGASKTGRSWLMLWLAMRVSQGLPVWDRPTKQCDVLYLCLEDSFARIQRRMYQLSEEEPLPSLRFAVLCEKLREGLEEQITSHLRTYPATGLVIIDTLQKVRPVHSADAGNMYACDYEDMTLLKSMADRYGIAVLVVHHLRKTKDKDDHRCVLSKLVKDRIHQRPVELQHHILQLAAVHLERLFRELRHAVDLGDGLIGEGGLFHDFQPVDAVDTIAGRALRVLAAVRHQIVVVFVEDQRHRLYIVPFLLTGAGSDVVPLGLFIQVEVVERDLLFPYDRILDAVHRIKDGFVSVLPGVEADHVLFQELRLVRSTQRCDLLDQLFRFFSP